MRSHQQAGRIGYSAIEASLKFQQKLAQSQLPEDYQSFLRGLKY